MREKILPIMSKGLSSGTKGKVSVHFRFTLRAGLFFLSKKRERYPQSQTIGNFINDIDIIAEMKNKPIQMILKARRKDQSGYTFGF